MIRALVTPPQNRRASAEAIEKRRAARAFNDLVLGGPRPGRDGRTEKRRQRLLRELRDGTARGGRRELKPIDVLARVQALLDLGEPLASIKKACAAARPLEVTPELVDSVGRLHEAYRFAPETYRFVGIEEEVLRRAGVLGGPSIRRTRPKGSAPPPPAITGAPCRPPPPAITPGPAKTEPARPPARRARRAPA